MNKQDAPIKRGRKFDQVVAGAREVFLKEGFEGASVDSIARAAGVSKATLYSYFRDKRLLFLEVARMECLRQTEATMSLAAQGNDPREALTAMARRIAEFTLSDFGLKVFRICVAEAERFPELGRTFYQSGPEVARRRLTDYLKAATQRGTLRIDDCRLAADQFVELCRADLFYRRVFNLTDNIQPEEITRIVDGAVDTFLARYAPRT